MTEAKRYYLSKIESQGVRLYNKDICKRCGGECCKMQGCILLPFDIEPFESSYILKLLENGEFSIRAFYEENMAYPYLAAREMNQPEFSVLLPHTVCAHLTEKGCKFSDEERPTGAIVLTPNTSGKCMMEIDTDEIEEYWKKPEVYEVMMSVVKHYIGDYTFNEYVRMLFNSFEDSILNNTCGYNYFNKYCIYHDGLKFGYHFREETRDGIL